MLSNNTRQFLESYFSRIAETRTTEHNIVNDPLTTIVPFKNSNVFVQQRSDIPNDSHSDVNHSSKLDFINFISHSKTMSKNNIQEEGDKLFVLNVERELLQDGKTYWTDLHAFKFMNRALSFKEHRVDYLKKIRGVDENFLNYLTVTKDCSKKITEDFIKSVYYTQGNKGMVDLRESVVQLSTEFSHFNPNCLQLYNIVIYGGPFLLCRAISDCTIDTLTFSDTYRIIALELNDFIFQYGSQNLTYSLRLQMRLEQTISGMGYYNLYEMSRSYLQYSRRISIFAVSALTSSYILYLTYPRLGGLVYMGTVQIAPAPVGRRIPYEFADIDRVIAILRDMSFND